MNEYVDTLDEWYENAERVTKENLPNDGDTIIYPAPGGAYKIEAATFGWVASIVYPDENVRILARAPKPKPAWHDSVAVIASPRGGLGRIMWQVDDDRWSDGQEGFSPDDMEEVTPLIEAKVTEEMVDRAYAYAPSLWQVKATARRVLTAALGLENA